MNQYDGDAIYEDLKAKIGRNDILSDVDMLNLIFLPLMRNTIPRYELAANSVKLAQSISDTTKRNACIAASFVFAAKYLDEKDLKRLKEVLRMSELATMFVEEGRMEGRQEGKEEGRMEIAKDMLKENEPIEKIIRFVRLDESTIIQLKTELDNEG